MDVRLTDEQELLVDTATQLARALGPAAPAELPAEGPGDEAWALLTEAGWTGLRVPEAAGGGGSPGFEVALFAEQLGRASAPVPFLGVSALGVELLHRAGAGADVLGRVAGGALRLVPGLEPGLRGLAVAGSPAIAVDARGADGALVLDGAGPGARLVAVRCGDRPLDSADLTRTLRPVADDAGRLDLGDLGGPLDADALMRWEALALAVLSADLLGVMTAALDAAVAHVRDRYQFGVPVGSFQAVQHMAADALVSVEATRSVMWHAAWAVDELEPAEALLAGRVAKAYASEAGRDVAETAIQMFGGIGMTWECMAHVHLRRVLLDRQLLGDEHVQYEAIADARLDPAAFSGRRA